MANSPFGLNAIILEKNFWENYYQKPYALNFTIGAS